MTASVTSPAPPFSISTHFTGNATPPPFGPNVAVITQREFAHDVMQLQFWADDVDADSYMSGAAMWAQWGRTTVQRTFYGYVNEAERISNAMASAGSLTGRNSTEVRCVGASWMMKEPDTRTWQSMTADAIVTTIAGLFGLAVDAVPDTTVWPSLQMAGMSYWEFCVCLAKRIGYTFYCDGIQLVFKPRNTNPNYLTRPVVSFDFSQKTGGILQFSPVLGSNSTTGGQLRNRHLAALNPYSMNTTVISISGSPTPYQLGNLVDAPIFDSYEHITAHNQQQATARLNGVATDNQLYLRADAMGTGNPLIGQGCLINILNANGSQNGFWYVEKAVHTLTPKTYTMQLCLGRDSRGPTTVGTFPQPLSTPPQGTLQSGTWVAMA